MSAIKSNVYDQMKNLANEGTDVSTVADFVFNEQKMFYGVHLSLQLSWQGIRRWSITL
jgi:hypothetical protein